MTTPSKGTLVWMFSVGIATKHKPTPNPSYNSLPMPQMHLVKLSTEVSRIGQIQSATETAKTCCRDMLLRERQWLQYVHKLSKQTKQSLLATVSGVCVAGIVNPSRRFRHTLTYTISMPQSSSRLDRSEGWISLTLLLHNSASIESTRTQKCFP